MNSNAPISSAIHDLLALFEDALAEVRFPDVDRDVLAEQVRAVDEAFAQVTQRQAELEQARSALDTQRAELLKTALRAQQYARVYASDDAELSDQLESIVLQPTKKPRKPRRKKEKATTQLKLAKEPVSESVPLAQASGSR